MRFVVLLCAFAVSCSPAVEPGPVGGGVGGGGSSGGGSGGGGGRTTVDAGRMEGELCLRTTDCATGLSCVLQVSGGGSAQRCVLCATSGATCGDGGVCLTRLTSSGTSVTCSFGRPGDPCDTGAQCASGMCESVVTASGVTTACR